MSAKSGDTLGWRFAEPNHSAELELGETLYTVGLPAQEDILDALYDATGTVAHCVWVWDNNQTLLWRVDAKDVIPAFARRCAADVVHLWPDAPLCVHGFLSTGESASAVARAAATIIHATHVADAAHAAANATHTAAHVATQATQATQAANATATHAAAYAAAYAAHAAAYNAAHAGTYAAFADTYAAAHTAAKKKYVDMLISMLVEAGIT